MQIKCLLLTTMVSAFAWQQAQADGQQQIQSVSANVEEVEKIIVITPRSFAESFAGLANFSVLNDTTLTEVNAEHAHDLFARVPGLWISKGSGQEHLTAIRSPVLTGTGACGAFLVLEQGLPVRPSGFCNVNSLFEVNLLQAASIEVIRGPASGLLGGNALHGAIHVRAHVPNSAENNSLYLEAGQFGHGNLRLLHQYNRNEQHGLSLNVQATQDEGWRKNAGFHQAKLNLTQTFARSGWRVLNSIALTNLDQQTAGFITGRDAYQDNAVRRANFNPEAYRDAWSWRASTKWLKHFNGNVSLSLTPYIRRSDMTFRQHFLPGKPLEHNSQSSGGVLVRWIKKHETSHIMLGAQAEYWEGRLNQTQDGPATGSAFLIATRPVGKQYEYEVAGALAAFFHDFRQAFLREKWVWLHTFRLERLHYDYDNQLLSGNTKEDGSVCGFGGCLYSRPADREDSFNNIAGRVGLIYRAFARGSLYAVAGRSFRPPQATELYRLQSGQEIADLEAEVLNSIELGWSGELQKLAIQIAVFRQNKDNQIFRDAQGFNVSDGKTRGLGLEAGLNWRMTARHQLDATLSWAKHQYDFNRMVARGESIARGNEVDTAPNWLANVRYRYRSATRFSLELEFIWQGEYALDAANTAQYPGHRLFNLRLGWQLSKSIRLHARVLNVTDEQYADRADFAFNRFRYFPGLPIRAAFGIARSY